MPRTGVGARPGAVAEADTPGIRAFALSLYLLASCTTVMLADGGPRGAVYDLRWILFLSDVFLGLVVVASLPDLPAVWREPRRHRAALAAAVLGVSLLPAWIAHPSAQGNAAVLRWFGVAVVALAIGRLGGAGRQLVVATFAAVTLVQLGVALAERVANGTVGLRFLGEPAAIEIGGRYASSGLTIYPYVLAAWCVLGVAILGAATARSERGLAPLATVAVVACVGVGLTMSRAGLLAQILVLGCLAWAALRSRPLRVVVGAAVVATAVGILLNLSGWVSRAADTSSTATVGSNRGQLLAQASGLFRSAPVLGVGPGRYVQALVHRPDLVKLATQKPSRPVHLVPYLVLVEGGLVVLPGLLFLAWAVLNQTWRGGALGAGITLAVAPFLFLDHLNWSYPQGLLLTSLWLGALDQLAGRPPP